MGEIILKGHKGLGKATEGEALVSHEAISFYADVDAKTGVITNKLSDLFGMSVRDKILIFPTGKGGIGSLWQMAEMKESEVAPRAIINVRGHPIFVQACILLDIPTIDRFNEDPTKILKTGDRVLVDPERGMVKKL